MKSMIKRLIFLYVVVLCPLPTQAQQLVNLSSWNMEWLDLHGNERFAPSLRNSDDFYKMSHYLETPIPMILAFQEVSSNEAISKVVGDQYNIYLSDRSLAKFDHLQFEDINQYTGFAVAKSLPVSDPTDINLLSSTQSNSKRKLRFASYIIIETEQPIHLLNVHLKAGCSGKFRTNRNCNTLRQQAKAMNDWISDREASNQSYAIVGDFNHNLAYPNDWMWEVLAENTSARLATQNTKANCKVRSRNDPNQLHQFRSLIDHMVVSKSLELSVPKQMTFRPDDVLNYQLSDHCPISATLTLP